jgi:muramidase (phage lysozyme)
MRLKAILEMLLVFATFHLASAQPQCDSLENTECDICNSIAAGRYQTVQTTFVNSSAAYFNQMNTAQAADLSALERV